MTALAAIAIACALAAAALLALGIRGRRVGQDPHCRRCGFNLRGMPEGADRCPECGRVLAGARSVRLGERRRRPGVLVCGTALLLIALGAGSIAVVQATAGANLTRYKPAWMLARIEARSADDAVATAALNELVQRLDNDEIEAGAVAGLIRYALQRQADRTLPWNPALGDLIETAWAEDALTDGQTEAYLRNSVRLTLELAEPVEAFWLWPSLDIQRDRTGTRSLLKAPLAVSFDDATLNGEPLGFHRSASIITTTDGNYNAGKSHGWIIRPRVEPGVHELAATWTLCFDESLADEYPVHRNAISFVRNIPEPPPEPERSAYARWTVTLTSPVTILGEPPDLIEWVGDATLEGPVRDSISISDVRLDRGWNGKPQLRITVAVEEPPVGVCCMVIATDGEREWPLQRVLCATGGRVSFGMLADADGLTPGPIDVILRPDADAPTKASLLNMQDPPVRLWGEPLTWRGIEVPAPDED